MVNQPYGEATTNLLTVNLLGSALTFWSAARLYGLPRLGNREPCAVLLSILLLHAQRHAGIPPEFAWPAAEGDALAVVLALVTRAPYARVLVWEFNVEARST